VIRLGSKREKVEVEVRDPLVAGLIRQIAKRSNDGALEYGHESLLDRVDDPLKLIEDGLEEAIDQLIYLGGALQLLSEERKIKEAATAIEEAEFDDDYSAWNFKNPH
tara:strand:- start:15465 stop:15785 length:321 start_codon:yes stop_codon:yes gene_type:complete